MNRRDFIQITTAGSAVVLVPSLLAGCGSGPSRAYNAWKGHTPEESDIRLRVLSYAILAPNPHNKQPWIVDLKGETEMDLYVDPKRLLPETDPPFRQIHIGQGTFLENLDLAAREMGYRADITYFPTGMYENTLLERKPVANIVLTEDTSVMSDPLFHQILTRRSNKREYNTTPLTQQDIGKLKASGATNRFSLTLTDDPEELEVLRDITQQAMEIEVGSPDRDAETLAMFRFNDKEVERYRDGFSVANAGVTGLKKWIAESFFLSRDSAEKDSTNFAAQSVDLTTKQTESAAAFGWITSSSNTRLDQVEVGRVYERVNLTATATGVALHPISQVLQEYDDMAELQKSFKKQIRVPDGHTVQMLFRLGYAEPTPHTPRRELGKIIINSAPSA